MENTTFETGATTAAANNLVLSVLNDGAVYHDRLHIGFAMLQGASHKGMTFRDLANNEANNQRTSFGSKFKAAEISEASKIIQQDTLQECLDNIRVNWNGEKVIITIRRWFDKVYGNSYFSALIQVPTKSGFKSVTLPFEYGYGSHPEWAAIKACEKLGLFVKGNKVNSDLPVVFHDQGYMLKRDMFDGIYW